MKTSINAGPKIIRSLIGIGGPMVDITATIGHELIKQFGIELGRTVQANKANMGFIEYLESRNNVTYIPGGSISNTLRITRWCLNMSKDEDPKFTTTLIGSIGNDVYGKIMMSSFDSVGVNYILQVNDKCETSRCAVGICNKERALLTHIRASSKLNMDFILKNIDKILQHDALLVEGYFINDQYPILKFLVDKFHQMGKKIIFSLSAVYMIQQYFHQMLEFSNKANLIFCNHDEAMYFSGTKSLSIEETALRSHRRLQSHDNRIIVITCGKNPVVLSKYDYKSNQMDFILKSYPVKIKRDEIVDTNGAGDAFLGGFMSQWMQGKSYDQCMKGGNLASGVIIKSVGCTYPKDYRIEFDNYI